MNDRVGRLGRDAEKLILRQDHRRAAEIAAMLRPGYLGRVAGWLVRPGTRLLLATGFSVDGAPETDGPPGARAISDAVRIGGGEVLAVCDDPTVAVVRAALGADTQVAVMPIEGDADSQIWARALIDKFRPTVVGFIERCGRGREGRYRSMRGLDLSPVTAQTDFLIAEGVPSFSIGDGGNEVGFGRLSDELVKHSITPWPSVSIVDELIVAAVSNWGGYALAAAIAWQTELDIDAILPSAGVQADRFEQIFRLGAVDGYSGLHLPMVDGRPFESEVEIVNELKRIGKPAND